MTSNTSLSFKDFPAELRGKIWLLTFEPRTLSLSTREHRVPEDGCGILCSLLTFDIQLGLHVEQLTEEEAIQKHNLLPQFTYMNEGLFSNAHRIKPPPGPIALQICQESREIALKHYERMFPGRVYTRNCSKALDTAFDASGWGDAHTWVNPKLDLVFLSLMSRDLRSRYAPLDIQLFSSHCKLEHLKLERVGAMYHNGLIESIISIRKCTALKELVVYTTDPNANRLSLSLEHGRYIWDEEVLGKYMNKDLQRRRGKYNDDLLNSHVISLEGPWTQEIPWIQISQEIDWYWNERMRLTLGVEALTKGDSVLFRSPGRVERELESGCC